MLIDKENLFMTIFFTLSSFYSNFTQAPKTFNSTVDLQVSFLKDLGGVATDLLDLVSVCSVSDRLMMIRSDLCVEHWLLSDKNLTGLLQ